MSEATIRAVKEKLDEERIDLTGQAWQFRPDPENNGLDHKWQLPTTSLDDSWKPIHIGQAWEGQGYPTLDGWAWYRIDVDIPQAWKDRNIYVSFEGADDYYELFVNGQKVGTGGDIETKTTAFEERKSHDVTRQLKPGETAVLAVRIYDWYGAGGLFRPITIGTAQIEHCADGQGGRNAQVDDCHKITFSYHLQSRWIEVGPCEGARHRCKADSSSNENIQGPGPIRNVPVNRNAVKKTAARRLKQ